MEAGAHLDTEEIGAAALSKGKAEESADGDGYGDGIKEFDGNKEKSQYQCWTLIGI